MIKDSHYQNTDWMKLRDVSVLLSLVLTMMIIKQQQTGHIMRSFTV